MCVFLLIFMKVFLNGEFLSKNETKVSVFDHGFLYGDGCFETLRTYNGKIFRLGEHLKRLRNSCSFLKIRFLWKDEQIEEWLQCLFQYNQIKEARIRITVTRGENDFNFCETLHPTLLMTASELIPHHSTVFEKGVKIETLEIERLFPSIKSLNLLPSVLGQQIKKEKNVFETVFINHNGFITEGTVSNFFILKKNIILTAPKENILAGITRDVVLEIAKKLRIPCQEKLFTLKDAYTAEEAFLTSTIMDIVPVIQISKTKLANGKVGNWTQKLIQEFFKYTRHDRT